MDSLEIALTLIFGSNRAIKASYECVALDPAALAPIRWA
jgi:hypothetical protein